MKSGKMCSLLGTVQILRNHRGGEGRKFFEIFDYARTCPVFSIGGTCDYGVAGGGRVDPEKSKIFDYVIFGRSLRGYQNAKITVFPRLRQKNLTIWRLKKCRELRDRPNIT